MHALVRWANLIRIFTFRPNGSVESYKFFLIDFEFAGVDGDILPIEDYIFSDIVSMNQTYSYHHDLCLVSKLVQSWGVTNNIILDADALAFISLVQDTSSKAAYLLTNSWLIS